MNMKHAVYRGKYEHETPLSVEVNMNMKHLLSMEANMNMKHAVYRGKYEHETPLSVGANMNMKHAVYGGKYEHETCCL